MVIRNDTVIKILYFDTCAIIKYFVREKGSGLIKWIVDNQVLYSLTLHTSQIAIHEFNKIIKEKEKRGELSNAQMKAIIAKSKHYFRTTFHVRDFKPIPRFRSHKDTDYLDLCNKHGLKMSKNSRDARHLACVINYLRCCGGISRPRIMTADSNFSKIIRAEGYDVINPEKVSKDDFLAIIGR